MLPAARTFYKPVIPVTDLFDLCGVCCIGRLYAHDHGIVSVAAGIREDSRKYGLSHFAGKSLIMLDLKLG